ncbi:hypothetical protein ACNAW0_19140 [Micromonospora sp. SL1-18]|uniref:hypothetical protein n=1 Tax=Micromonospora sp. SL1-18 TaxID=3399128 RepID=UPI003A4D647E
MAAGSPAPLVVYRVLGMLARRLVAEGARWGVAAICVGVGQGMAVVLENVRKGGAA